MCVSVRALFKFVEQIPLHVVLQVNKIYESEQIQSGNFHIFCCEKLLRNDEEKNFFQKFCISNKNKLRKKFRNDFLVAAVAQTNGNNNDSARAYFRHATHNLCSLKRIFNIFDIHTLFANRSAALCFSPK